MWSDSVSYFNPNSSPPPPEMPWDAIALNDGNIIPSVAFGSATRRSSDAERKTVEHLLTALNNGFVHLDTAQQYGNEADVGEAIRRSAVKRDGLFITTKWSDGSMPARQACEASLKALGVDVVDLYVIHHTWTCNGDVIDAWRQMEAIKEAGLARSIGLSAFGQAEVAEIVANCRVRPAVNMIMLHPGVLRDIQPLLDFMAEHRIVPGGYSSLKPLWAQEAGSAVAEAASRLGDRYKCSSESVLLRWCASKGAVVFTSSTSSDRIKAYLDAGHVILSSDDVKSLDDAGLMS